MRISSISDIAAVARGRRSSLGINQADLARSARVSRKWISEFEAGKPTAELGLVIRVLERLGLALDLTASEKGARKRPIDLDALLEAHRDSE